MVSSIRRLRSFKGWPPPASAFPRSAFLPAVSVIAPLSASSQIAEYANITQTSILCHPIFFSTSYSPLEHSSSTSIHTISTWLSVYHMGNYVFAMLKILARVACPRWAFLQPGTMEYLDDCMPYGASLWHAIIWCLWRVRM